MAHREQSNGELAIPLTRNGAARVNICLLSIHGLIRAHDLELGRDADTGGQTKYVVDLARALAAHPRVGEVLLVTRLRDPAVGPGLRKEEVLAPGGAPRPHLLRATCTCPRSSSGITWTAYR
ncbi:MAG: hypothetical protein R3E50_07175 [Halioglobus sp.]